MGQCDYIKTHLKNGVLVITIDRPDKKNAINRAMYDAMRTALTLADTQDDIHVVLFQGSSDSFTAGNDLADFNDRKTNEISPGGQFLLALHQCKKPIIAAVSGLAVGIGTTILLHCDLVYAASETRFRLPFVNLGLCPEAGSTLSLPMRCGHLAASDLFLFGEFFGPEEALSYRLINAIIPAKDLEAFTHQRARVLAQQPQKAVIETKRLLKAAHHQDLRDRILEELDIFGDLLLTEASQKARQAALKK